MNKNHHVLDSDDVLSISEEFAKVAPYHTIRSMDFLKAIREYIESYLQDKKQLSRNYAFSITAPWIGEGVTCELLSPDRKWKTGTVKLALVFEPDEEEEESVTEPDSPLDDIRQELSKNSPENA